MNPPEQSAREREDALRELASVERDLLRAGAGHLTRLHIALGEPPVRRLVTAFTQTGSGLRRHGSGVRSVYDVPLRSQAWSQWTLALRHRLNAEEYYLYQLYLPERRRGRSRFIPRRRTLWLLRRLYELTRPDLDRLRDKRAFAERCAASGLPTPPVLAVFEGGTALDGAGSGHRPRVDLFAKPSARLGGLGAVAWTRAGEGLYAGEGGTWTEAEVRAELERRSAEETIVLQERLANHPVLAPLTNGALCTARIVTLRRPGGGIECILPTFRLPWGDAVVDNFARGGLMAPVDLESGEITGPAVRLDRSSGVGFATRHPDSGEAFVGFRLPHWERAVELTVQAAETFSDLPFVGWDVALLEGGPTLIEGNVSWNPDGNQLAHGRGLGDTAFVACFLEHLRRAQAASSSRRRPELAR